MQKIDQIYLQILILVPIEEFNRRLSKHNFIKLVFVDNKKILGFVFGEVLIKGGLQTKKRKVLAIHEIGVDSSFRRSGIGTKLIDEIKRIAIEKNCDDVNLSVWSFNINAINCYVKNGFEIQSLRMEFKLKQKEGINMKNGTQPSKRVERCLK